MIRWMGIAILGALLLAGCSTVQVSQDYRKDVIFTWYHNYAWKAGGSVPRGTDIRAGNPLLHERFHQEIDRILAQHGYILKAPPDFLVGYDYSIESRIESDPYSTRFGAGFGRHYRYGELGFGDYVDINQYDVAILAINFYDAQSGKLIWRGIGSARVSLHTTPEETTVFVDKLVTAVLAQFPPL